VPAYQRRFGRRPTTDGFLGPPVFSTPDGPQKADFLRAAGLAAAARQPRRLRFVAGVTPERLPAVGTAGLWDYARLVVNGPQLVPSELRDEAAILSATVAAVGGTDHRTVLTWMRQTLDADQRAGWAAVGAGRFCEEYLHERLTGSPDHLALVDIGLRFLLDFGILPTNVSMQCLTETERARLRSLA